jgi:hypothetical protein
MKFTNALDVQKNTILTPVIHPLSSAPSSPVEGQSYYSTTDKIAYFWNGTAWANKASDSTALNGQNAAFYLARANHTGTQLAASISDLVSTVQSYRLDQFSAPTATVSFGNQRISTLADPVNPQDAATMSWTQSQVANAAAGIDAKASVRILLNTNDTLSGLAARDGITPIVGDRVLARGQTTASQNGVYVAAAGAWARATDADATAELTPGAFWFVEEGTTYGKTQWRIENTGSITVGTTSITINQFGGGAAYTASLGVVLVANDFRAQVVASGGVQAVAGGLQIDMAVVARGKAFTIGNGAATSIAMTHNFGTKRLMPWGRIVATDELIPIDGVATDTNTFTANFSVAPASNSIEVTLFAIG